MSAQEMAPTRCDSGISGLNQILGGGFPSNALYLVQGDPGVGKTTLALQFLMAGARASRGIRERAVTAAARDEDRVATRRAGFQAHMAKPIKPDKLVRTVLEILSAKKQVGAPD
jgi:KaiC/GvpD/RAD55 family RecA-like ATPase